MERRRERRISVDLPGSYRRGGETQDIFFSQLSPSGCRLTADRLDLAIGDIIALHLGPVGPVEATVRWVRGGAVGVQFAGALEAPIVAYFAAFISDAA